MQYMNTFGRSPRPPWPSQRYISLSPVRFANRAGLKEKLYTLASSRKSKTGEPRDRSRANTQYCSAGDGPSVVGTSRAAFEHQRVFIRLLREELEDPSAFALRPMQWSRDIRIVALAYNLWAADMRLLEERERDPKILDVGWTVFDTPRRSTSLSVMEARHIVLEENRLLNNHGAKRLPFINGTTETLNRISLASQLQQLFSLPPDGRLASPMMLLVHNARATLDILRALGVDTSRWVSGISDILYSPYDHNRSSRWEGHRRDMDERTPTRSARSQSPRARQAGGTRPRSPHRSTAGLPSVYVVDVRDMYLTMNGRQTRDDNILSNARDLCIEDEALGNNATVQGESSPGNDWCAGNESRLLGCMWSSMARGPAVDEQCVLRWRQTEPVPGTSNTASESTVTASATTEASVDPDDSDFDPNDLPTGNVAAPTQAATFGSFQSGASRGNVYVMDPEGGGDDDEEDSF
ncbi:hypothetical protein OBBRIDRAFT_796710 [Obba rivulosa]|uniref:Uncharacterized protein n=1 Tax=Obba rivulosa TaxID=1052685 RepID=A0A8E2DGB0_9APHY|nr:hypothetical protein OBBRIDRAFT_796710 [Obba rivulosa]